MCDDKKCMEENIKNPPTVKPNKEKIEEKKWKIEKDMFGEFANEHIKQYEAHIRQETIKECLRDFPKYHLDNTTSADYFDGRNYGINECKQILKDKLKK